MLDSLLTVGSLARPGAWLTASVAPARALELARFELADAVADGMLSG